MDKKPKNIDELVNQLGQIPLMKFERTNGSDLHSEEKEQDSEVESSNETDKLSNIKSDKESDKADKSVSNEIGADVDDLLMERFPLNGSINNGIILDETVKLRERESNCVEIDFSKSLGIAKPLILKAENDSEEQKLIFLKAEQETENPAELNILNDLKIQEEDFEKRVQENEIKIKALIIEGIHQYQIKFRTKCEIITILLIAHYKDPNDSLLQTYKQQLKDLTIDFEKIINAVQNSSVDCTELFSADKLCKKLDHIEESIIIEMNAKNIHDLEKFGELINQTDVDLKQDERFEETNDRIVTQKQQQQAKGIFELKDQILKPNNLQPSDGTRIARACLENSSLETINVRANFYDGLMSFYKHKLEHIKPFLTDELSTRFRNTCEKIINTAINAIINESRDFLSDNYDNLMHFLNGKPQSTSLGEITINNHPLARDFCNMLMAKSFIDKKYLEISNSPCMAFPVASVIVSIWKIYPEFGTLYLALTFKQSPLLAPINVTKKRKQSDQEYLTRFGYNFEKNDTVEEENVFLKKQAGIARLYGAVILMNGKKIDYKIPHPYGIENGWLWLVHFVRLPPLPKLSANILLEMLQIMAADLLDCYGRQFKKLLIYIQQYYMPQLNAIDNGGPKIRLEMLLETYLKKGLIRRPKGFMDRDFW